MDRQTSVQNERHFKRFRSCEWNQGQAPRRLEPVRQSTRRGIRNLQQPLSIEKKPFPSPSEELLPTLGVDNDSRRRPIGPEFSKIPDSPARLVIPRAAAPNRQRELPNVHEEDTTQPELGRMLAPPEAPTVDPPKNNYTLPFVRTRSERISKPLERLPDVVQQSIQQTQADRSLSKPALGNVGC